MLTVSRAATLLCDEKRRWFLSLKRSGEERGPRTARDHTVCKTPKSMKRKGPLVVVKTADGTGKGNMFIQRQGIWEGKMSPFRKKKKHLSPTKVD